MRGLSLVAASGGHSSSRSAGLSLSRPLLLRSTGSRRAGSVVVAHGPSCSAACGVFPDQGSNPCPPHWQADSQPLRHQGSPLPRDLIHPVNPDHMLFLCGTFYDTVPRRSSQHPHLCLCFPCTPFRGHICHTPRPYVRVPLSCTPSAGPLLYSHWWSCL